MRVEEATCPASAFRRGRHDEQRVAYPAGEALENRPGRVDEHVVEVRARLLQTIDALEQAKVPGNGDGHLSLAGWVQAETPPQPPLRIEIQHTGRPIATRELRGQVEGDARRAGSSTGARHDESAAPGARPFRYPLYEVVRCPLGDNDRSRSIDAGVAHDDIDVIGDVLVKTQVPRRGSSIKRSDERQACRLITADDPDPQAHPASLERMTATVCGA